MIPTVQCRRRQRMTMYKLILGMLFLFVLIYMVMFPWKQKYTPPLFNITLVEKASLQTKKPFINCEYLDNFELFLRMFSGRKQLYEYVFVKSLSIFWACRQNLKLVVVLDNESYVDHIWGEKIKKKFPFPRVLYEDPNDLYHGNGHIRQQYSNFYAERFTNATYVGFVDTDTLFTTLVTPNILFDDIDKPVVIGRVGHDIPYWETVASNTKKWFGVNEILKGMSYFPVVIKVDHLIELRHWMEEKHEKPFDIIFKELTEADQFSQFTIMCQYMWLFHPDEYSFHLEPLPNDQFDPSKVSKSKAPISYYRDNVPVKNWIPQPRSSIHWDYPQPNPPSPHLLSEEWLENFIGEGFCYSLGLSYCPEKCVGHRSNKIQERLYLFESFSWDWHPLALQQQKIHYKHVDKMVLFLNRTRKLVFGFRSIEEACEMWPDGYNFVYPKGQVATRH